MIRKLTDEEIAASKAAVKRANQDLSQRRKELSEQITKLLKSGGALTGALVYRLMKERDAIRDVRGLPVQLVVDGKEFVLNYDFLRMFFRKLKGWTVDITVSDTSTLLISYGRPPHCGQLDLRGLPKYQVELLDDLPRVVLQR